MPARRPKTATPALDTLSGSEHANVLAELLATHPDLRPEAERTAQRLLGIETLEAVAEDVAWALEAIPLEDLTARSGRIRGRGYVHENEAAWEILYEVVEPFLVDLRRRAGLGMADAAAATAIGVVAGLYQAQTPEDGTVVAYAGPDEVIRETTRLGVAVPSEAADQHWPKWSNGRGVGGHRRR